jgi:thioredoxin reductase
MRDKNDLMRCVSPDRSFSQSLNVFPSIYNYNLKYLNRIKISVKRDGEKELIDCAIIGGGPAGLNAGLVLGRSRRKVLLFDDNKPRNAVTHASHGFLTRDGIKPSRFREVAHDEISRYPNVSINKVRVINVEKLHNYFLIQTVNGEVIQAKKVLLATGLKEILPDVKGIRDYYGKSLFNCPYCDGWELKDKPLVVIADTNPFHMAKIVYNWSRNLIVCTNGNKNLTGSEKGQLQSRNIQVYEQKISCFIGDKGYLTKIVFEDGTEILKEGGFAVPQWIQSSNFGQSLGCFTNGQGGIITDEFGRTNIDGVYAAGDTSIIAPSQLIIAAGEGSKAAIGVNTDLTNEDFC